MKNRSIQTGERGFTLLELLVVMAVIAVLAGMLVPALARSKDKARYINEVSSARQVMIAHRLYTDDNAGQILPGYRYGFSAVDPAGNEIAHPVNARYPWRLASYCGDNFELLYSNRNSSLLRSFRESSRLEDYVYSASVFPSLGVNSVFVGGDDLILPPSPQAVSRYGEFCVLQEWDARRPSELLVFASARSIHDSRPVDGFYKVLPPYLARRNWATDWSASSSPEAFGFVHPRYNGRAVTAMMDGHVDGFTSTELQDMRRWANHATNPSWKLSRNQ